MELRLLSGLAAGLAVSAICLLWMTYPMTGFLLMLPLMLINMIGLRHVCTVEGNMSEETRTRTYNEYVTAMIGITIFAVLLLLICGMKLSAIVLIVAVVLYDYIAFRRTSRSSSRRKSCDRTCYNAPKGGRKGHQRPEKVVPYGLLPLHAESLQEGDNLFRDMLDYGR